MRAVLFLASLLAVALVSAAQAAPGVRITYVTPSVSPGGTLTIKAVAPAHARCSAVLLPAGLGAPVRLSARVFAAGRGSWAFRVPSGARNGLWQVLVTCTKGGSASARFRVGAAPVAPAQIAVIKSGFSTETFGSSTFLHCGVQLHNTSTVSDARKLTITVTFVDTQGRSLKSDEIDLSAIPAGQTFYASCLTIANVTLSVASVQVNVKVGSSVAAKKTQLPVVSGVQLTADAFGGTQTLTGSLTNSYSQAMPEDAEIYAVYFDSSGNIVGGDSKSAGASVQPGATVSFSFPFLAPVIASAQVSVDPCGFAAALDGCTLP